MLQSRLKLLFLVVIYIFLVGCDEDSNENFTLRTNTQTLIPWETNLSIEANILHHLG